MAEVETGSAPEAEQLADVASEEVTAQADERAQDEQDQETDPGSDGESEASQAEGAAGADDGLVEHEFEGWKGRIPQALKDANLRWADYSQKTAELATDKRTFADEMAQSRQAAADNVKAAEAIGRDYARIGALNQQLHDWQEAHQVAMQAGDPEAIREAGQNIQRLEQLRNQAAEQLVSSQHKYKSEAEKALSDRTEAEQVEHRRLIEEGNRVLQREIPGWGPDMGVKLGTFANTEFGFSAAELENVTDPRMMKVLHLAFLGQQAIKANGAAKKAATAAATAPAKTANGARAPVSVRTTDPASDRMDGEAWAAAERRRVAQLRAGSQAPRRSNGQFA